MATVYLETSFVSACVTTRTDVTSLYQRQQSVDWWASEGPGHTLFVSAEVIRELSHPAFAQGPLALALVQNLQLLDIDDGVTSFADRLVREKVMPGPVAGDAIHVAVCCLYEVQYLLSWNVRHLANPNKLEHLGRVCRGAGLTPPRIVVPDLLWNESDD